MTCWQCHAAIEADPYFCQECRSLQPPNPTLNHFECLGLATTFAQELQEVTQRHRELQRRLHPDRFASASAPVRRLSVEHATAINDALRVVKDPMRRALYCLKLKGIDINDEHSGIKLDPMFLMKIIELREAITELRGDDTHVERGRIERDVAGWYEEILVALGQRLDQTKDGADLTMLAQDAAQLKYLRRALDDLHAQEG